MKEPSWVLRAVVEAVHDAQLAEHAGASGVRDHPFVDGNKRAAFLAAYVFLRLNGRDLVADEISATTAVLALASGEMTEADFAAWLSDNSAPL